MPQIDLRIQAIAKQIGRNRRGALSGSGLMPHAKTLAEIARNPSAGIIFPAISACHFRAYLAVWERLFGFFRDDEFASRLPVTTAGRGLSRACCLNPSDKFRGLRKPL